MKLIDFIIVVFTMTLTAFSTPLTAQQIQLKVRIDPHPYHNHFEQVYSAYTIIVDVGENERTLFPNQLGGFAEQLLERDGIANIHWEREFIEALDGNPGTAGYVLWPFEYRQLSPSINFRFVKLDGLQSRGKATVIELVRNEKWAEASALTNKIVSIYSPIESSSFDGFNVSDFEYAFLRDISTAMDEYRDSKGRSAFSDEAIALEREWRRRSIRRLTSKAYSINTNNFRVSMRKIAAVASWSDFARETYSNKQRGWPERTIESTEQISTRPLFHLDEQGERNTYKVWMEEDLRLVFDTLLSNDFLDFITNSLSITDQDLSLVEENADLANVEYLLNADPYTVNLNRPAYTINNLNLLRIAILKYCSSAGPLVRDFCQL